MAFHFQSIAGIQQKLAPEQASSSNFDKMSSVVHIELIFEQLKANQHWKLTQKNYHYIWRSFNKFLIKLDTIPISWEQRILLFGVHLVDQGYQSTTLQSYVSAIKNILTTDGIELDHDKIMLGTLARVCKLSNDRIHIRLPIKACLLEVLLFELERLFSDENPQPYLESLYKAMFTLAFYGLLRVGEISRHAHLLKACNLYIGRNKNKILAILYISKTHGLELRPQKILISSLSDLDKSKRFFCPLQNYLALHND